MKLSGRRLTTLVFVGLTLGATLAMGLLGFFPHHHVDGHCPIAAASGSACPVNDTIASAVWHVDNILGFTTGLVASSVVSFLTLAATLIAIFAITILTKTPLLVAPLGLVKARFDAQSGLWRPATRWIYRGRLTQRDPRTTS